MMGEGIRPIEWQAEKDLGLKSFYEFQKRQEIILKKIIRGYTIKI